MFSIKRKGVEVVQINVGNLCNMECHHCHIEASPHGKNIMDLETAIKIIEKLKQLNPKRVELTGGAPEMNPHLEKFIIELSNNDIPVLIRTNLTILTTKKYEHFVKLYAKYGVSLVASLPDVYEDSVEEQRGDGSFSSSIKALHMLNEVGYSKEGNLSLNLVYNPVGAYLPPEEQGLNRKYKRVLKEQYNIDFDSVIPIVNSPIKRFKEQLLESGEYGSYIQLLKDNYNEVTLDKVMCRDQLSVDFDGSVYDCDFNLALKKHVPHYESTKFWEIEFSKFHGDIYTDEHCLSCTAGMGSSCSGSLVKESKSDVTAKISNVKIDVQEYYGDTLSSSNDLKTSACCTTDIPQKIRDILSEIHDEVIEKYYGCGTPIPALLEGLSVLDLGSGTGRDCFLFSKLVGENGMVYGIDMTNNQITVAKKYQVSQAKRFGYKKDNVKFIHDEIENISTHFEPNSLDLVTSNCVINLVENKRKVIKEVYEVLKNGGEMYFSDVYSDRRLTQEVKESKVLYGECLGGALYVNDFEEMAQELGFKQVRRVEEKEIEITDPEIQKVVGNSKFYSITYRLWKLEELELLCEDYGHVAIYNGGIEDEEFSVELDADHQFEIHKPELICGNTAKMITETRYAPYFTIVGDFSNHLGIFPDCATNTAKDSKADNEGATTCC